jgi:2-hydroxychromene-2-carboxylate isomerase
MKFSSYRPFFLAVQHDLHQVRSSLQQPTALQPAFQALQRSSQALLALDPSQLETAIAAKVQSYQTEISRLVRLLGMDILFLQAARQSATTQQRAQQASDRISQLLQYCDAVLEGE